MSTSRPTSRIPTFSQKKAQKRDGGAQVAAPAATVHNAKRRKLELNENAPPAVTLKAKARLRRSVSMSVLPSVAKKAATFNNPPLQKITNGRVNSQLSTSIVAAKPAKRPGWDLRGQLQDVQQKLGEERALKKEHVAKIRALEAERQEAVVRKEELEAVLTNKELTLQNVNQVLSEKEAELISVSEAARAAQSKLLILHSENQLHESTIASLKCTEAKLKSALSGCKTKTSQLEENLTKAREENLSLKEENFNLKANVSFLTNTVEHQRDQLREGEKLRRQMHNMIQDLKGTIRVFCRVRPLLGKEVETNPAGCVEFPDTEGRAVVLTQSGKDGSCLNESNASTSSNNVGNNRQTSHGFAFDRVFHPGVSQSEVFHEISQLVQSALDGYNVCIFAYGPTGSGKTYTMEGNKCTDPSDPTAGMIPRGVEQVFSTIKALAEQGWEYEVEASFLEIYNEAIRDLLTTKSDKKCEVKLGKDNEVYVNNISLVKVTDSDRVYELLAKAQKNRAVAETNCNERSSRSHSVFTMKLFGNNSVTGDTCKGSLNLVDLAGSERLKSSGSEGDRLREAKNINKSLSNLGSVILALGQKADHIPYRNSKLTFLLMNSLGGNSKTLMFINISPSDDHYYETLNSLRFAKAVNECYVGVAQKRK